MAMLPVTTHNAPYDIVLYAVDVRISAARCALSEIFLFFSIPRVDTHIGAAYKTTDSQIP